MAITGATRRRRSRPRAELCALLLLLLLAAGLSPVACDKPAPDPAASPPPNPPADAPAPSPGPSAPPGEPGSAPETAPAPETPLQRLQRVLGQAAFPEDLTQGLGNETTPAGLRARRPSARASRLHETLWIEQLDPPFLSATYRFAPEDLRLLEIRWALDDTLRDDRRGLEAMLRETLGNQLVREESASGVALHWNHASGSLKLVLSPPESAGLLVWRPRGASSASRPR